MSLLVWAKVNPCDVQWTDPGNADRAVTCNQAGYRSPKLSERRPDSQPHHATKLGLQADVNPHKCDENAGMRSPAASQIACRYGLSSASFSVTSSLRGAASGSQHRDEPLGAVIR